MVRIYCLLFLQTIVRALAQNNADLFPLFDTDAPGRLPGYQVIKINGKFVGNNGEHLRIKTIDRIRTYPVKTQPDFLNFDVPDLNLLLNPLETSGLIQESISENLRPEEENEDRERLGAVIPVSPEEDLGDTVENHLVVKPVPDELLGRFFVESVRKKRSDSHPHKKDGHVIYINPRPVQKNHFSDYVVIPSNRREKRIRPKRQAEAFQQDTTEIFVDTLIFVDYSSYENFGKDEEKIRQYQKSFWNAVDLKFRTMKAPQIFINVVGIIIAHSPEENLFIAKNIYVDDVSKFLLGNSALQDMGKHFYKLASKQEFDIAITVTNLDMCSMQSDGSCSVQTMGLANVGGACVVKDDDKTAMNVAIIEDTGGYSGVLTAAHEIGHLLRAVHDGQRPPGYENLPGARACRFRDGYMMSYESQDDQSKARNKFRWSKCSVNSFNHFLRWKGSSCLRNKPQIARISEEPRALLTLDEQCMMERGTKACYRESDRYDVCFRLYCYKEGSTGSCIGFRPAADGSDCGRNRYCINGRCVTKYTKNMKRING